MNKKHLKGWLKHADFILIDIFCLHICFLAGFWVVHGFHNPYTEEVYRYQIAVLIISQLVIILFTNNYGGILRRKKFDEAIAVIKYTVILFAVALIYLYIVKSSAVTSRLQYGFTALFFLILSFLLRQANKKRVMYFSKKKRKKSLVLVTGRDYVTEAVQKLSGKRTYQDFFISGVVLLDSDEPLEFEGLDVPVYPLGEQAMDRLTHGWVDEVFILQPDDQPFPTKLLNELMLMGITVNFTLTALNGENWSAIDLRKLGSYKVLTNSVRFASVGQIAIKRIMDIIGGLVGCLFTGLLFLFVAPAIYIKSPGPIFFKQERVGRNGKVFKIHKFRSMYMDAEERKAELMAQNRVQDGMMFKMDDDPRIIGSERKNKNGKPRGIGNFIRVTSIDEFPQFFDVLTGKMSLVGWRPCTLEEWEKYDLQHRIRASMKPGLTGMWQVSGRSKITDFNEVVRLDKEYIENWSILLDIKILLKTVFVVLTHRGAE